MRKVRNISKDHQKKLLRFFFVDINVIKNSRQYDGRYEAKMQQRKVGSKTLLI